MKDKYNHLPLKAYEVYEKEDDWRGLTKEYSHGVFAGHTAGQARARVAAEKMSGGYTNPWPCLLTRRVHGPKADRAIEALSDRGKHWRDKSENLRLQAEADAFNAKYPVGTPVQVLSCEASTWPNGITKTRTPAWLSGPGCLLVSVEGYSGGFGMEFIKPLS